MRPEGRWGVGPATFTSHTAGREPRLFHLSHRLGPRHSAARRQPYNTLVTANRYLNPYQESARKHGSSFDVTLWASRDSQERRFGVFTQMCDLAGKRILDAGCSRGDLAHYLLQHEIAYDHYVGVDALCEVISYAQRRDLARCEFHRGDFIVQSALLTTGQPQVICISGALNTMSDDQVALVLESAWSATSESLLFNFLSDRAWYGAPTQTGPARRLDTLGLLRWAMARTWSVAFRQDYFEFGHDATILMRKPQ